VERNPDLADADVRGRQLVSYRTGDTVAPALANLEALRSVMVEFAAAIAENRRPLTDGFAGLRVLAILEAASESLAKDGESVPIRAVQETPRATAGVIENVATTMAQRGRGEVTV
jgi:predicted dehydrogenase